MPLIYRIKCEACGKEPIMKSFVAGWVTTDREKGGTILPDGYMALKRETGEFVCLPHPIEHRRLESYGFTWNQAAKQKRLYRVTFKICATCGLINEEASIVNQRLGCGAGIIAAITSMVVFRVVINLNWPLSLFLGWVICFATYFVTERINKVRQEKSDPALSLKSCSGCGESNFVTIPSAEGTTMPCPMCKAKAMEYRGAGFS